MGVYAKSVEGPLRQGEILSGFSQFVLNVERLQAGEVVLDEITHPYVIVLAQDCDLEQNFNANLEDDLASVLFCAVDLADAVKAASDLNSKEWKLAMQNTYPRYHYIRAVLPEDDAAGHGIDPLAIDFKQYFSLPTREAYHRAGEAARRARLDTPYAEHISQRFASYLCRIALPLDHHREAPPAVPLALPPAPGAEQAGG